MCVHILQLKNEGVSIGGIEGFFKVQGHHGCDTSGEHAGKYFTCNFANLVGRGVVFAETELTRIKQLPVF